MRTINTRCISADGSSQVFLSAAAKTTRAELHYRLPVHKGDRVKAGQVLVELWNDDLIAQVALVENELHAVHARRDEACLNAANAEREVTRATELQKKGLVSDDIVDEAVTMKQALAAAGANSNVEESQLAIVAHLYVGSKASWDVIASPGKQFETMPGLGLSEFIAFLQSDTHG